MAWSVSRGQTAPGVAMASSTSMRALWHGTPTPPTGRIKMSRMSPYTKHLFICTNVRPPGSPRGCCSEKGSEELRSLFKKGLKARGLALDVRANASGCLDTCEAGPSIVVDQDGVCYGGVKPDDVAEI